VTEPTHPGDVERTPRHRSPSSLLLAAGAVATGLILIFTIGVAKPPSPAQPSPAPSSAAPASPPDAAPHAAVPAPEDRPRASDLAELDSWARRLAAPTKLAPKVLVAYGRAEMWLRGEVPTCHLSWATLAGIGQFEAAGSGPLPVSPEIWGRWSARATQDGKPPDPQNVDDAAYTTGRYLCSAGADLATGDGWWRAVLGYTQSVPDTRDILTATNTLAATPLG
jgi:membrane-bound lytic murein transglycosylase B